MLRRSFLLGTLATAGCAQDRNQTAPLGTLAYIDEDTLWLRDLPDGVARPVATGRRLADPRFSITGQRISFRDGNAQRAAFRDGRPAESRQLASRARGPGLTIAGNPAVDEVHGQYAWTSRDPDGKTALLLSPSRQPAKAKKLAESEGYFEIAGFTKSGDWLVYWMAPEMSASIRADGLELCAANANTGQSFKLGIDTLVHADMIAFSPAGDLLAVTAGGGRETWANKTIALIDFSSGNPMLRNLTPPSVAAQLPAWSPDGKTLAWSAAPDAEALHKQQLLARGQKTITVIDPQGARQKIPITPDLSLGAPEEAIEQCLRLRRIWTQEIAAPDGARELTNDAAYCDEEPMWSRGGSHILFCRRDASLTVPDRRTIWLMRSDASEVGEVAGPLRFPRGLSEIEKLTYSTYYGYTDWCSLFDWWQ
jgi:dipeptidyl aminopeptidase/acylaminoacyl peptidase